MNDISNIKDALVEWAESQDLVQKLCLFGGCAKGNYPNVTDIDVAIEIVGPGGGQASLADWISEADGLRASLAPFLPVKLDLQWYGGEDETPNIHAYLQEASETLYAIAT